METILQEKCIKEDMEHIYNKEIGPTNNSSMVSGMEWRSVKVTFMFMP
jgi:hypothetical protein